MTKTFASKGDLEDKKETFTKLAEGAYCLTAEGDPNSGVIIGEDGVMVLDTRATPAMAQDLLRHIRGVTDKPVKYVLLTHYHAVRVMGAAAYPGATIIASRNTYDLIRERGAQDFKSEVERFPRLFRGVDGVPGLTWPHIVFDDRMTVRMGSVEVEIMHLGAGHTKGDTIAWLAKDKVLFSGDLVEEGATPYCGDAHLEEWPKTLQRLRALKPRRLVPGRGDALMTPAASLKAIDKTAEFVTTLYAEARKAVRRGKKLKHTYDQVYPLLQKRYGHWAIFEHCMPFDITRAFDEASGVKHPRIWTAERDIKMWKTLQR